MADALDELIEMSRELGNPAHDYVILGEGNTSVAADDESFWVKASGTQLIQACRDSFVRVRSQPVLDALESGTLDDAQVKRLLESATIEGRRTPSIETFLHALCLRLDGVRFVGHTHPTVALGLLAGRRSRELFCGNLFPDQIVLLGPALVYVPYEDPGLPLALAVRREIDDFLAQQGRVPRVILMENHGVIALGGTASAVLNATEMLVKTCRILAGTLAAGGPRWLTAANVERIDRRPDELARRRDLSR
jgi:rhamnose utilization protein RhaD (predicted bifunctional aldolase and dehydrogenase)